VAYLVAGEALWLAVTDASRLMLPCSWALTVVGIRKVALPTYVTAY
jgi:hypothetical protein